MAKPDLVKVMMRSDGTVLQDMGKGYREIAVKGATSEELSSTVVEKSDTCILTISDIPVRDHLKITFDLSSLTATYGGFRYVFTFNEDDGSNYSNLGGSGPEDKVLLLQSPPGRGALHAFGSITCNNRGAGVKIGHGFLTYVRGRAGPAAAIPMFSWTDTSQQIETISLWAETLAGNMIPNHRFLEGTRIKVLGRSFN